MMAHQDMGVRPGRVWPWPWRPATLLSSGVLAAQRAAFTQQQDGPVPQDDVASGSGQRPDGREHDD